MKFVIPLFALCLLISVDRTAIAKQGPNTETDIAKGELAPPIEPKFLQGLKMLKKLSDQGKLDLKNGAASITVGTKFEGPQSDWLLALTVPYDAKPKEVVDFFKMKMALKKSYEQKRRLIDEELQKGRDAEMQRAMAKYTNQGYHPDTKKSAAENISHIRRYYAFMGRLEPFFNKKEVKAVLGGTAQAGGYEPVSGTFYVNLSSKEAIDVTIDQMKNLPVRGSTRLGSR